MKLYSIVTVLILFGNVLIAQFNALTPQQITQLDAIATRDVPPGAPGVATGIVRNGQIVYTKVAGYANLEDSLQITPDTRFNIASNGKQFTALAILLLEQEGKLRLTDDIRTFFPKLYSQVEATITIEDLLNHSSGIRDVYDLWSLQGLTWWEHPFGNADALTLLEKQQSLNFSPGSQHAYSNSNYILLAEIVAKVSGQRFVHYTKKLFEQLNMPNTFFVDKAEQLSGPIAKPYFNFDTWFTYDWIWNGYGDGNIFSTLQDQLQWEKIVQQPEKAIIPEAVIRKSQQLTNNAAIGTYGYGLEFGTYKGLDYTFHDGATGAWKASFVRFPEAELAVVTLINTGKADPYAQTKQMADIVLDLPTALGQFATEPVEVGKYLAESDIVGTYLDENNTSFQFVLQDEALYLKRLGRNDTRLVRESANIFHQWNDSAFKQEFKRNDQGEMEVTAYYTSHAPYTLRRPECDWKNFSYQGLNGQYYNPETDISVKVKYVSEQNYEVEIGEEKQSGLLISPEKMLVGFYNFTIKNPNTLLLNSDRSRNVAFVRER